MSSPSGLSTAGLFLAIDSGSPTVSVAIGSPGETLATRAVGIRGSSEALLALIDEVLDEVGASLRDLEGIVALAGPGSFTGLRVGLATVVGLHLSSGVPSTTLPTLDILALQGSRWVDKAPLVAAVDAQRGEWAFAAYEPGSPPSMLRPSVTTTAETLAEIEPELLIGFGCSRLAETLVEHRVEPAPLAPTTLDWLSMRNPRWDSNALYRPIYSRPPAVYRSR